MNKKITLLVLMMATGLGFRAAAQLSGTYTINSAVATGGTNYISFTAAVAALTSSGVSGPVVFNVAAGTSYTGQISMGAITGASATNTITFNGNGATVTYAATTTYAPVLLMNGTKYVKFDSLTFNATGTTYAYGAILYNTCKFDSITRCTFNVTSSSSTTSSYTSGIRISYSTSSGSGTTTGADSCYFGYNNINGPTGAGGMYYGIYNYGLNTGLVFDHNTIANFYYYGIYNYYSFARCKFLYNDINRATKTDITYLGSSSYTYAYAYGLYNYGYGYTQPGCQYVGNRIHDLQGSSFPSTITTVYYYPIYFYYMAGTAAEPVLVANNAVYNTYLSYNYFAYFSSYINIYHNSVAVNLTSSTLTSAACPMMVSYGQGPVDVKNNVVTLTGGTSGTQYGVYAYNTGYTAPTIDYNDIYVSPSSGTGYYGYWNGSLYATHAAFQTGSSQQANGLSVDPQYTSVTTGNLKPQNTALTAAGTSLLTLVPKDILLNARPLLPTMGAYENGTVPAVDAGVAELTAPTSPCYSTYAVKVKVANYGATAIDSLKVGWSLGGVLQTPVTVTTQLTALGTTGSSTEVTLGNYLFTATATTMKAWTYDLSAGTDTVPSNDTLTQSLQSALSGTFTVNSAAATAGTNFQSFTDLTSALNAVGVCGPVVVNVVAGSGPYTNQSILLNDVSGTSATNTIKINGNGNYVQDTTSSSTALLMLNGTKYIKIDSLNFKTVGYTSDIANGGYLYNSCAYDSITRCIFDLRSYTGSSTYSRGISLSSVIGSVSASASGATQSYFGGNTILGDTTSTYGMQYGIYVGGPNDSCVWYGNTIKNFYYMGIYNYYSAYNQFLYNDISRATKNYTYAYAYGIYVSAAKASYVYGNRIHDMLGQNYSYTYTGYYAIYVGSSSSQGSSSAITKIYNNVIYDMPFNVGIFVPYGAYVNVYHNTIDYSSSGATLSTQSSMGLGGYCISTTPTINFYNNIVSIVDHPYEACAFYFYDYTSYALPTLVRNATYFNNPSATTSLYFYGYSSGTSYATQALFQAAYPTQQVGATTLDPNYLSPTTGDFTPQNTVVALSGSNTISEVPKDINGYLRLPMPSPGAFETPHTTNNDAGMVALVAPLGNLCPGTYTAKVSVYNNGANNITSLKVNWKVNGVLQTQVSYTNTLANVNSTSGTVMDTVTLGTITVPATGSVLLDVWTSLPNGTADGNTANDTLATQTIAATDMDLLVSADTICTNTNAILSISPSSGYATGTLTYQWGDIGGSFPNSDTSDLTTLYPTPGLATATSFRVRMTTSGNVCYSDTQNIYVSSPSLLWHTPDTMRCGPGPVTLHATPNANSIVNWYEADDIANPVYTGNDYLTPSLTATDTFWVNADVPFTQPTPANVIVAGTATAYGYYGPVYYYGSYASRRQYIITAAEMYAQGYSAGNITSIGHSYSYVYQTTWNNMTLQMGLTSSSTLSGYVSTGLTTVFSDTVTIAAGVNYFDLQTPFYWDGASNIIVSWCYPGGGSSYSYSNAHISSAFSDRSIYYISSSASSSVCSSTSSSTTTYIPDTYFKMISACGTDLQPIVVTVNPLPAVDLGADVNICVDSDYAVVLDAALQPYDGQYLWDNGDTSQIRAVTQSGTYYVSVTNLYTCVNSDTIEVTMRPNPIVDLGDDTTVCEGVALTLDAGNQGIDYFWNTGATTQTLTTTAAGTYSVLVTNSVGCTKADTLTITQQGQLPSIGGIQVTNNGANVFTFTLLNPQNATACIEWDFGDGTTSNYQNPTHPYTAPGNYVVVVKLCSSCGYIYDTAAAHILGINNVDVGADQLTVYPNPTTASATIWNKTDDMKMEKISVFNVLGQLLYEAPADSRDKHSLELSGFASGVYTIQILTDKGMVSRKLDIVR
ncbi:MAG: PKD domain-containing protein [Edaphocola sp.]